MPSAPYDLSIGAARARTRFTNGSGWGARGRCGG